MNASRVIEFPKENDPNRVGHSVVITWWPGRIYSVLTFRIDQGEALHSLTLSIEQGVPLDQARPGPEEFITVVNRCDSNGIITGSMGQIPEPLYERKYSELENAKAGHAEVVNVLARGLAWNPLEHTDQENLGWSWLRAVEWGSWPAFLSQAAGPVLLLFLPWWSVVVGVVAANVVWATFVRYRCSSILAAYCGVFLAKLKWLACPVAAYLLYRRGDTATAALALFWPLPASALGIFPTTQVGVIQRNFMSKLGYERTS